MTNPPIPPGAGYSPTIHPQDFYEQQQSAPQPPPRNRGNATLDTVHEQYGAWGIKLHEAIDDLADHFSYVLGHKNAVERTGSARTPEMQAHVAKLSALIMVELKEFAHHVAPGLHRIGSNSQQPQAHGRMHRQPPASFQQAGSHEHEGESSRRHAPPAPSHDNAEAPRTTGFNFDALSEEEKLQVMPFLQKASQSTMSNARKSVHYPTPSQGWRRNHHISEAENPEDDARVDADGALSDSDNQSFKDQPIASPTGRQGAHETNLRTVPSFDELYDVTEDESTPVDRRKAQSPPRTQGPALPPRQPSADLQEDTSDAPENRPKMPPRPAASTAMPMSRAAKPTPTLSDFPPPPSAPPFRGVTHRPQGPAGEKTSQLPSNQSGGIKRKAVPMPQVSTQSAPPDTIPPHINDWVLKANDNQLELLLRTLSKRLRKPG
ncbi:hypothetical protein [Herbaspirillum sp. alder98]|uniref:hypothetical protein n=1 Tax=Herbaspirillum sp. alder98 TaxID=2913096 RepID=UPI001CD86CCF|nr:hypothetical protein [Herbaspirillum sp. alder98]MCA1325666.1 hypothetical protein [Herbaspirillum sp. alder98]